MEKITVFLILILSYSFIFGRSAEKRNNNDTVLNISDSVIQRVYDLERERVVERADKYLEFKPRTVTAFSSPRSMGGKHDFFSEGPYWWPDPANPDGAYIRHDGLRNPDRFVEHDDHLRDFSWIVGSLVSAYQITRKENYIEAAMLHINAWLVDSTTRMNPNMLYAQAIKGICTGRGIGIIDALPLMDVARSVRIIENSNLVSAKQIEPVKAWFSEFIEWLTTHQYGIDEMNWINNHSTWWHAQVAVYAKLVDNQEVLNLCRNNYKEKILPNQMALNGSFPEELDRTKPYGYSLFNLDAITALAWTLTDQNNDMWNYTLDDGRGIKKGLDFMLPYLKDKSAWPYGKDISHWEKLPDARQFMLYAAIMETNREWFTLWNSLQEENHAGENRQAPSIKNPLLWMAN